VRHLGRGVDHELVQPVVAIREHRAALERHGHVAMHAVAAPEHDVGGARRRIDVAVREYALDEGIAAPTLMHEGRGFAARKRCVNDGRDELEIDVNGRSEVLGIGARASQTSRDRLACESHFLLRERRIAGNLEAADLRDCAQLAKPRQIAGGEDAAVRTVRNGNAANAGVNMRAAHEGDFVRVR
jgi:hypothetical protein